MPEESKLAEKLENANKFTEEELTVVREIQNEYVKVQNQFGQLSIARIRLSTQNDILNNSETQLNLDFENLQKNEKEFLAETTKKYGEGSLNPETGEFTPIKSQ